MSTQTRPRRDQRSWVAEHPVTAFTGLALTGAYVVGAVMVLIDRSVIPGRALASRLGFGMEETASLALVVVLATTTLFVTGLSDGRAGISTLLRRTTRWRVGWRWWAVAVAALPLLTIALSITLGDELVRPAPGTLAREALATVVALLMINVAEELSWAGFLQTRLERRHNLLVAAVITAIPFALVHVPIRVIAGDISGIDDVLPQILMLLVLCVLIRTLLGAVLRGAANSVLLVAMMHTSFNRSNNVDGLAADVLRGEARTLAALIAALLVTAALIVTIRRRLGRAERARFDEVEEFRSEPSGRITSGAQL
ncbi:CPBP family intramembrane glutamic endopeptidase [Oryzobacter telluris]|uniref:CPBP family intramembrane glutamic endopeptidase n=1 Tax=Oryzobacter telluris TaxID=3149179 RepID=UPI00370DBCE9